MSDNQTFNYTVGGLPSFVPSVQPSMSFSVPSPAVGPVRSTPVLAPSPVTAAVLFTPPPTMGPSFASFGKVAPAAARVAGQVRQEIANAAKTRTENAPEVWKFVTKTGPTGEHTFDVQSYLKGIYRNRYDEQLAATSSAAKARGLPDPAAPAKRIDLPLQDDYRGFYDADRRSIAAPIHPVNQKLFVVDEGQSSFSRAEVEGAPFVLSPKVALSTAALAEEIIKHEVSHSLSYTDRESRSQYVRGIAGVIDLPFNMKTHGANLPDEELANAPYPIQQYAEFGPAAGALQRYYASTHSGDRLDSPEKYDKWIKQFDDMSRRDIFDLPVTYEVKRALLYRQDPKYRKHIDNGYRFILPATFANNFVPSNSAGAFT